MDPSRVTQIAVHGYALRVEKRATQRGVYDFKLLGTNYGSA